MPGLFVLALFSDKPLPRKDALVLLAVCLSSLMLLVTMVALASHG